MTLPAGLEFLQVGWWVIHVLATALVYLYAYRKGRADARREMRAAATPPRNP